MGDPARQPPDGFHLLGHSKLALQSSSFGDIFRKYLKIIGTTILTIHAVARASYDDRLATPLLPFQLDVVHDV